MTQATKNRTSQVIYVMWLLLAVLLIVCAIIGGANHHAQRQYPLSGFLFLVSFGGAGISLFYLLSAKWDSVRRWEETFCFSVSIFTLSIATIAAAVNILVLLNC